MATARAMSYHRVMHSAADVVQASVSKDEAMSEASHAAAGANSSGTGAPTTSLDKQQAVTGTGVADSPATAAAPQGRAAGQQASSSGKVDTTSAGAATASNVRSQQPGVNSSKSGQGGQQIKIVINSTHVSHPVGSAAGADSNEGGTGVKRSLPAVEDLSAEVEGVHAAKRARQQEQASPGDQGDSGVILSELPEVAAAMNNPSNLQVSGSAITQYVSRLLSGWSACSSVCQCLPM